MTQDITITVTMPEAKKKSKGGKKKATAIQTFCGVAMDKSGSMFSIQEAARGALNEYKNNLARETPDMPFSLAMFDTSVTVLHQNIPVKDVPDLTEKTYTPGGMTALYDAVGALVRQMEERVGATGRALIVIITDGQENSSREWNQTTIKQLIQRLEATGRWTFVYLSSDPSVWAASAGMGIYRGNTVTYTPSAAGVRSMSAGLSASTTCYARGSAMASSNFFGGQESIDPVGTDAWTEPGKAVKDALDQHQQQDGQGTK